MIHAVISSKDKNEKVTRTKVVSLETNVAGGKYRLKRGSEKLIFKTEEGVENYFKRKNRWADEVKLAKAGEFPKHDAGNNWILSTGEKITGKDEALRLEPTLN